MQWKRNIWTLANAITILKIPLAILFPWSTTQPGMELANLAIGGISDFADGRVARRMGQAGGFGAILDPLCDKIFLLTVVGTYVAQRRLPLWALGIVIFRDVYILAASTVLVLSRRWRHVEIAARFYGKAVTCLQFVLFISIAANWPYQPCLAAIGALSVLACYDYTMTMLHQLGKIERPARVSPSC